MNSVAEIFEKITQTVTSTVADVATTVTDKVKSNEQFQTGKQFLHGQVTRFVPLHTQVRGIQWMQKAKFRVFNVQEFPAFIEQPIPEVATLALAEIDVSNPFLYKQKNGSLTLSGCVMKHRYIIKPTVRLGHFGRSRVTMILSMSIKIMRFFQLNL